MLNELRRLDLAFQALADPTRRGHAGAALARAGLGQRASAALRDSLPAVMQHLQALEAAGWCGRRRKGGCAPAGWRRRRLPTAERWIAEQRALWEGRLDRLEDYLEILKKGE